MNRVTQACAQNLVSPFISRKKNLMQFYRRRPRRPPFLRVESDGIGVTSSEPKKGEKYFTNWLQGGGNKRCRFHITSHNSCCIKSRADIPVIIKTVTSLFILQ